MPIDPEGVARAVAPNSRLDEDKPLSTYTQIYYHIVFGTKYRERVLREQWRDDLFKYIWGIVKNQRSKLYRINGVEDHLHMLTSLHPMVNLGDFIKAIKTGSSKWIKQNDVFPSFSHWQDGYGAFTHSAADKDRLIEYIKSQPEHHKTESFEDEFRRLLKEAGIEFDEKCLFGDGEQQPAPKDDA